MAQFAVHMLRTAANQPRIGSTSRVVEQPTLIRGFATPTTNKTLTLQVLTSGPEYWFSAYDIPLESNAAPCSRQYDCCDRNAASNPVL